ncbi:PQQ-binding-like beta-propeller repeat protein [Arthrobacter sp. JSM 101049]|uniref:outer membrane protein assembly factor BamB family protein n=1 Tax=Arthrobacter sp. JSM 101049 TaxID=929097 RepID=UPI003563A80F
MGKHLTTSLTVLALLPLVLTTACTGPPPSSASSPAPGQNAATASAAPIAPRSTAWIKPVWTKKLEPIGQPLLHDGVALAITGEGQLMELVALDVKNGKELWRKDYHPGDVSSGIVNGPAVAEDSKGHVRAVFLQRGHIPDEDYGTYNWTVPVAVDLKSGKEVYRGKSPELATSRPDECDDGTDLCYRRWRLSEDITELVHVDLATGQVKHGKEASPLGEQAQPIGAGGLVVRGGDQQRLARADQGKVLWQKNLKSVFGAGASTGWGWSFDYLEEKNLFIGAVGIRPRPDLSDEDFDELDSYTIDATDQVLVGIQATTGKVLWKAGGAHLWCRSQMGTSGTRFHDGEAYPVRCEFLSGSVQVPGKNTYRKGKARLVGYDPLTGKTAWKSKTVKLAQTDELLRPTAGRGDYVLTGKASGNLIVDAAIGKNRRAAAGETFFCTADVYYNLPIEPDEESPGHGAGGDLYTSCKANGKKAKGYTVGAVKDVDNAEQGVTVVAEEGKLLGFKLPPGKKS